MSWHGQPFGELNMAENFVSLKQLAGELGMGGPPRGGRAMYSWHGEPPAT